MKSTTDAQTLKPTRRLTAAESRVFRQVSSDFVHFGSTDAEMLTAYAEAVVRYQDAAKEAKRKPTLTVPTFNKATGNKTGKKIIRNPALTTVKEAQQQMMSLARRLLIDPASAEKRQRLLTKKARAMAASEQAYAAQSDAAPKWSEEEITTMMKRLAPAFASTPAVDMRSAAICELELQDCAADPECADLLLA